MIGRKSRKQATAYHEAGHAVMCWLEGVRIRRVSIRQSKTADGEVLARKIFQRADFEADTSPRLKNRTEKAIMIGLAGTVAQRIFNPRSVRNWHGSHDRNRIMNLAFRVCGDGKEIALYLTWLEYRAERMLRLPFHWELVEAVARAVLERETLTGIEASKVIFAIYKAQVKPPSAEQVAANQVEEGKATP
jgi:hypothetical protein